MILFVVSNSTREQSIYTKLIQRFNVGKDFGVATPGIGTNQSFDAQAASATQTAQQASTGSIDLYLDVTALQENQQHCCA